MKVMVTGNRGYIGSVLAAMLVDRGYDVVGLDSDLYRRCGFGPTLRQVPTVVKDIRDVEKDDLLGVEAICHLAALSNDPLGNLNPDLTYEINYRASVRLAQMAAKAGVKRFIFSSSCSTYGASNGDGLLDEEAMFCPVTPYGESKVMAEHELSKMADERFSPVFLRNATAYGMSPRIRFDLVLNNLVAWAFTTGEIMMKSDGSPWRPVVHLKDICMAFISVLEAPKQVIYNKAFNVGVTRDNVQIRELAEVVKQVMPGCRVSFAAGAGADKRCYRVNCDRLRRAVPSFSPKWDILAGAKQLYENYARYGVTLEQFEGPAYQRIGQIKALMAEGIIDEELRFVNERIKC